MWTEVSPEVRYPLNPQFDSEKAAFSIFDESPFLERGVVYNMPGCSSVNSGMSYKMINETMPG